MLHTVVSVCPNTEGAYIIYNLHCFSMAVSEKPLSLQFMQKLSIVVSVSYSSVLTIKI